MGEIRYMISEAAKQVHVESHVLRYWEEELNLTISRTEMGHRYYTEDDIQLFRCIKKLKNEGMLLKDLKPLIPKLKETRDKLTSAQTETAPEKKVTPVSANPGTTALTPAAKKPDTATPTPVSEKSDSTSLAPVAEMPAADLAPTAAEVIPITQLEQVRGLIGDVLTEVVTNNNAALEQSISTKVTNDVIREMDFLFQAKERREEEHYRKLDCLIRQQQANRKELAERDTAFGKLKKMLT